MGIISDPPYLGDLFELYPQTDDLTTCSAHQHIFLIAAGIAGRTLGVQLALLLLVEDGHLIVALQQHKEGLFSWLFHQNAVVYSNLKQLAMHVLCLVRGTQCQSRLLVAQLASSDPELADHIVGH